MTLLSDLSMVPHEQITNVAHVKRFLERWTMDPSYQQYFNREPQGAIEQLGLALVPEDVLPFIVNEESIKLGQAEKEGKDGAYPLAVRQYRAFIIEKLARRPFFREAGQPAHPRFAAWRERQIKRCLGELGAVKADGITHSPLAVELTKGCTVGCWFCAFEAPTLSGIFRYSDQNKTLWQKVLQVLQELLGDGAKNGFLYWAGEPMDNPDYELFLADFYTIMERCPQTTSAAPVRNLERTAGMIKLFQRLGSEIDRFSILSLDMLSRVHSAFSPEELLRMELIPQNPEAGSQFQKANSGRARKHAEARKDEVAGMESASTTACLSGFLLNMVDRSAKLITPCNTTEKWPLGYWILEEGNFETAGDLKELMTGMMERNMRETLRIDDVVALRSDLTWESAAASFSIASLHLKLNFNYYPAPSALETLVKEACRTAGEIASAMEKVHGVSMPETFLVLNDFFKKGLVDEEPRSASQVKV